MPPPMEPALLAAVQRNSAQDLAEFLQSLENDSPLDGQYCGLSAVQLLCMHGSWECIEELLRFYRRIGMLKILKHATAFTSLWRRGHRDTLYALVRIGLDPRHFLHAVVCEADFEGLLRCVRNREWFIREFQRVATARRLPCLWLGKYIALLGTQQPCRKN